MRFTGRSRELGTLRTCLDQSEPQWVTVSGLPGSGVSALIRRATDGFRALHFRCPPLPDPLIRATLLRRIEGLEGAGGPPSWKEIFDLLLADRSNQDPVVLVLDDAHRLAEARSRFAAPLARALLARQEFGGTAHVIVAGRAGDMPGPANADARPGISLESLEVPPLPLRAAAEHLPGNRPYDKIRAYGVFGGLPGVLAHLDPTVTLGTNVRRLLLPDHGALADQPLGWLERSVQTPTRYVSILGAMAEGDVGWAALSAAVPDLTRSGQIAPYVKRLTALGFVRARRSLDAPPRSRSTRYQVTDPFLAFWLRFVLPWRASEREADVVPHYASAIRPFIRDHQQRMMPAICRSHMDFDALETFGSTARENGSIWSATADIPVAGVLGNGAVYYGSCLWDPPRERPRDSAARPLASLDREIRETRYGFGREQRLRVLFTGRSTPTWLRREVARRHDAQIVDASDLVGTAG